MLDLKLLKTFVVVGRVLHFGRAAVLLHSTQPGVTQHVSRLEAQLGIALFERSKRSVKLTDAGQRFMRHASRLLLLAQRMEEEARVMASGMGGQLCIGLSTSVIYSDVPQRISRFKRENPAWRVNVVVHSGDHLQELLDAYALDLAITTLPFAGDGYDRTLLDVTTPMGVALQADHPMAGRASLSIASLARESFLAVPRERHPEAHDNLTSLLRATGSPARIAGYEVSFPSLIARVAMGEGVAIVPTAFANMAPSSVRVVPLLDDDLARLKMYLVARQDCDNAIVPRFTQEFMAEAPGTGSRSGSASDGG